MRGSLHRQSRHLDTIEAYLLAQVFGDLGDFVRPRMPEPAKIADAVKALKHFLVHYKAWIMAVLAPLGGIWAVFIVALIDAAFFGIPLDPVIALYVAADPRRTIVYALMGSLGSALGSTVPYLIGYKGGEALVVKKIGQQRFARMHGLSEKYGDMALIIPALMPPGFPFKAFALIAGVTEMGYLHFLLSIFVGRLLRFMILGGLIIAYGPEILGFLMTAFQHHRGLTFAVIAAIVLAVVLLVRLSKSRTRSLTEASVA
jgi:membrane protein YqaA with SNARE-associated domain